MKKIDLCMIAVIRPSIIEETMNSFMKNIIEPNNIKFNLFVNIDPIGEKKYNQNDVMTLLRNYSKDLIVNMPKNPSVVNATKWVLNQITSDFIMFKEDDIKFLQKLDILDMIRILEKYPKLSSLHTDKWGVKPGHKRTISKEKIFRCNFDWIWQGDFYKATQYQRAFSLLPSLTKKKFFEKSITYLQPRLKSSPTNILKGKSDNVDGTLNKFLSNWDYGYYTYYGNDKQIMDLGKKWKIENGFKKPPKGVWQTWQKANIKNNI